MASVVLKSLSILLGIFFIFVGTTKISPTISKELHKDLRKEYVKYAKVFPLTEALDFKVPSKWYRRVVGSLEIIFGLAMAAIPNHKIKNGANIGLLCLMVLAAYSHYMVGDPFDRSAPALVFFFMLSGRLVVWYQINRRELEVNGIATATANGIKQD
ncbi:putative acetylcholine receptor chaperone isoform X2 [Arctopsyche grandis]|uniref:putative acetylcholine receptor chaperone isoform X2 n=1 Tax=Arctopsyche grandis TaxID=121162 RepID=UPI00406D7853